jgi:hypothetical protein
VRAPLTLIVSVTVFLTPMANAAGRPRFSSGFAARHACLVVTKSTTVAAINTATTAAAISDTVSTPTPAINAAVATTRLPATVAISGRLGMARRTMASSTRAAPVSQP